jgi:mannosylglycerate hydrolase MGH1-like protein
MAGPLELLTRTDKWYLSAGEGLIWAPSFPAWLDTPGFWDEARLFEYPLAPLFTVAFMDDAGREIALRAGQRRWTPAALEVPYATETGLQLIESRMVLPGFVLGSEWQLANAALTPQRLHVVAWTTAPGGEVEEGDVSNDESELSWRRVLRDWRGHAVRARMHLALARGIDTWGAIRAEPTADQPRFALSPFWDRWDPTHGGLASAASLGGAPGGQVYLGVHRAIEIEAGGTQRLAVALRIEPDLHESTLRVEVPPSRRASSFAAASRASWEAYFAQVPTFRCADPYFERYWAYRWYGLRLNAIAAGWGQYVAPGVAEGIGSFHQPTAVSAPGHVRELRWAKDPEWARGVLRIFASRQRPDGSFPGRIWAGGPDEGDVCHADWGSALRALDAVHPSDTFLREVLPAFERYAQWLVSRDADDSGLVDVTFPNETGQAFATRYHAADPDALKDGREPAIGLKAVDAATYAWQLYRVLADLGPRAGLDAGPWKERAEKTGHAILRRLWDGRVGMFSDLDPGTGRRTGVRAAAAFYPYATTLVGEEHLDGFVQHLFDPREFWRPFPVPSTGAKDPLYDADAAWQGRRQGRPWNGRVWPPANSQVAEALAHVALAHRPALKAQLVEFLTKYVRMLFRNGDVARPSAYEHYHPETGRPSAYRGLDEHLHAWVNDLIVQYVIGLRRAGDGRLVVDPMPFPLDGFEAVGLPMQGALIDVAREADIVEVRVGGRLAGRGPLGEPLEVRL